MEPQGIDPRTSRKFRLRYEYYTHSIHAKRALYHMSYDPVLYIQAFYCVQYDSRATTRLTLES